MTDKMVYDAGKGDRYRKVDQEKFANNYDLIFRKKENTGLGQYHEKPENDQTTSQHRASDELSR